MPSLLPPVIARAPLGTKPEAYAPARHRIARTQPFESTGSEAGVCVGNARCYMRMHGLHEDRMDIQVCQYAWCLYVWPFTTVAVVAP